MTVGSVPVDLAAVNIFDARSLVAAFGVAGIFVVLFAETGLLIGFFLPGDSLLFTAGLLSSTAVAQPLPLPLVLVAAVAGALLGAQVGFLIGRRAGPALTDQMRRPKVAEAMTRSRHLLDRYGYGRAIVLARFVPLVRTVLNPVAGALRVPGRVFTLWQVLGGLVWTIGLVVAGFVLGRSVPGIDQYLLPVIGLIVVVSLTPLVVEMARARRTRPEAVPDDANGVTTTEAPPEPPPAPEQPRIQIRPRVVIVDGDFDRCARLAATLEKDQDADVVGTASDAMTTSALLVLLGPDGLDAALIALGSSDADGADTTARIHAHHPHARVWTYGLVREHPLAGQAVAAGANGVLSEPILLEDFRREVRAM
jgi:membrane-associated protein